MVRRHKRPCWHATLQRGGPEGRWPTKPELPEYLPKNNIQSATRRSPPPECPLHEGFLHQFAPPSPPARNSRIVQHVRGLAVYRLTTAISKYPMPRMDSPSFPPRLPVMSSPSHISCTGGGRRGRCGDNGRADSASVLRVREHNRAPPLAQSACRQRCVRGCLHGARVARRVVEDAPINGDGCRGGGGGSLGGALGMQARRDGGHHDAGQGRRAREDGARQGADEGEFVEVQRQWVVPVAPCLGGRRMTHHPHTHHRGSQKFNARR